MGFISFSVLVIIICFYTFWYGNTKALRLKFELQEKKNKSLPSLPIYYGKFSLISFLIPIFFLTLSWVLIKPIFLNHILHNYFLENVPSNFNGNISMLIDQAKSVNINNPFPGTQEFIVQGARFLDSTESQIHSIALAIILTTSCFLSFFAIRKISPNFKARQAVEKNNTTFLMICSIVAIITTVGIVFSLIFEAFRFFERVPIFDFLFGLNWSPQTAIREDQVASTGSFGAVPIFAGTLLVTLIAMTVAIPIGLTSAIYLSEYASSTTRATIKPILEILAGVPTVVYGFFAAITVGPFLREIADYFGFSIASESALAAGGVMGIMIIPFISSLSDDVISAVPSSLRDGSLAMGATKSETVKRVVLPAALPGIVGAILLAVSRAIGETMIVVMAAGIAAKLTANPFESVTTVTVQIVTLLIGDQEFDSAKTLSAFALGITLFFITLCLNVFALKIVDKYREIYE